MAFDWAQITRDFQQKYESSYIRVKLDKDFQVFWVKRVHDGIPPYILLRNTEYGEIQLNYDTEFEMSFAFPPIGLFQGDKAALLFVRKYARQWRRGIAQQTSEFICPYNMWRVFISIQVNEKLVKQAFRPQESLSVCEAINRLSGRLSVRLDNYFSIGLDVRNKKDTYLLWYLTTPIGEYCDNSLIIKEKQLVQEFTDYQRRTGDNTHVIVSNN